MVCEVNSKCISNSLLEAEFNISGYNLFGVNVGVAGSRGIIVYVDCDLTASSVDISSSFSEFMFVQIKLSSDCFLQSSKYVKQYIKNTARKWKYAV